MKKTLFAAILLPISLAIFSCKSTQGAAGMQEALLAEDESQAADLNGADASANDEADLAEEAAAESDTDALANSESADASADDNSGAQDESAANEGASESQGEEASSAVAEQDSNGADADASAGDNAANEAALSGNEETRKSSIAQSENGSLLEKIKNSNGQAQGEGAAKNTSVSLAPSSEDRGGAEQSARQTSAAATSPEKTASSGGQNYGRDAATAAATTAAAAATSANGAASNAPGVSTARGASTPAGTTTAPSSSNAAGSATAASASQATNEGIALPIAQDVEEEAPQEEKPVPAPSRSMTLKNNQFVDISYPGSGWIYLGEEDGGDHFIFQGRKLGNGETTFTLRSKAPGTALLRFYKNDILTGKYIDDWIQITISDKSAADAVHVNAPAYAEVVPPKFDREKNKEQIQNAQKRREEARAQGEEKPAQAAAKEEAQKAPAKAESAAQAAPAESGYSEKVQTVIQTSGQEKSESKQKTAVAGTSAPTASESAAPAQASAKKPQAADNSAKSLLEMARKAYDEKRYADALDLVQRFFDSATEDIDAGLYLEGLILEAKSEVRNIKSAIGAYDTLLKNWPQSQYWRRANERSIYLKRFYIDIR